MTEITRETLELAALAAGLDVACTEAAFHGTDDPVKLYGGGLMLRGVQEPWRPHLDDGDAMRLAVRLKMLTDCNDDWCWAVASRTKTAEASHDGTEPDKLRAWREAVTLCAAEIGQQMKEAK